MANFGLNGVAGSWGTIATALGDGKLAANSKLANLIAGDWKGVSAKITDEPRTVAYAQNEAENNVAAEFSHNPNGTLASFEITLAYHGSSLSLSGLYLGLMDGNSNVLISGISIKTANNDWPKITFKGLISKAQPIEFYDKGTGRFYLPNWNLVGKKLAQRLGFTLAFTGVNAAGHLTSSGIEATVDTAELPDDQGVVQRVSYAGATLKVDGEAVAIVGTHSLTWLGGLKETSNADYELPQANWTQLKFSAETYLLGEGSDDSSSGAD